MARSMFQPGLRNLRPDDSTILAVAMPADQLEALQAGQQAGYVGLRRDHASPDGGAGESLRRGTTQDSQDVVLRRGQSPAAGLLLEGPLQAVRSAHEIKNRFFLRTGEGSRLSDFRFQVRH